LIFRKKILYITIISIFLSIFSLGFLTASFSHGNTTHYIFQRNNQQVYPVDSSNLDLPLPIPSLITTKVNKIRLDLEKISVNKFFIVYSEIYGNQSHTAYHLFLTDLNKDTLNKDGFGKIYLKTSTGQVIKPVAQVPIIEDFPTDQPLGWKIGIIVKFPYKTQRAVHDLILIYKEKEFNLTGIYY